MNILLPNAKSLPMSYDEVEFQRICDTNSELKHLINTFTKKLNSKETIPTQYNRTQYKKLINNIIKTYGLTLTDGNQKSNQRVRNIVLDFADTVSSIDADADKDKLLQEYGHFSIRISFDHRQSPQLSFVRCAGK